MHMQVDVPGAAGPTATPRRPARTATVGRAGVLVLVLHDCPVASSRCCAGGAGGGAGGRAGVARH